MTFASWANTGLSPWFPFCVWRTYGQCLPLLPIRAPGTILSLPIPDISIETVSDLKHMIDCADTSFATYLPLQIFCQWDLAARELALGLQFAQQLGIFFSVKKNTWPVRSGMQSQDEEFRKSQPLYIFMKPFTSVISKHLTNFRVFIFKALLCGKNNFLISVVSWM